MGAIRTPQGGLALHAKALDLDVLTVKRRP